MSKTKEYKLSDTDKELILDVREHIVGLFEAANDLEKKVLSLLNVQEDSASHGWLVDIFYNTFNDPELEEVNRLLVSFEKSMRKETQDGNV
jgi:hypothetical protein